MASGCHPANPVIIFLCHCCVRGLGLELAGNVYTYVIFQLRDVKCNHFPQNCRHNKVYTVNRQPSSGGRA